MTTRRTALQILSAAALLPALPRQGGSQTLDLSIRLTAPPLAVAPMGVFLEAVPAPTARAGSAGYPAAYRPEFHEITYVWSLLDEGPMQTPEHLVAAHRRTDQAMGPFIARVFTTPGRHRVAVEAFAPDGRRGRAEITVEVGDPARAFGPDGTIVVAADGDFSGAPGHHPRNAVRTLQDAFRRYKALGVPQVQILLRRGQAHVPPRDRALQFRNQSAHCHIGAWGQGPRPLIDLTQNASGLFLLHPKWDGRALVLKDLQFRGGWDPTTELWQSAQTEAVVATRGNAALLLHNCREEGCAVTVNSRPPSQQTGVRAMTFFNAYDKTDFKDFLLLGPRDEVDVAITGCRVVQNLQALNGGENRAVTSYNIYGRNAHNFIRCSARRLYVASNDIFMRHGWAMQKVFDNPAFRINRNNVPDMRAVIARNHIEGMIVRDTKGAPVPMNLLIEQNYIVSNPTTGRAIGLRGGAASIRNNIVLEHDTPKPPRTGAGFRGFVSLAREEGERATRDMPFLVYNNSFILLRRDENAQHGPGTVVTSEDRFTQIRESNNLLWAPALDIDPTGDGPLETTSLGWDARYRGARIGWARFGKGRLPRQMFPGDTLLVPYWTDYFDIPLGPGDFAGQAGRHAMIVSIAGKRRSFDALSGDVDIRFEAQGVRVTNTSPARWPAGADFILHCDRGSTPSAMQTQYAHPPGTIALYSPLPGAGARGSARGDLIAAYDFLGRLRPGTWHPDAPSGDPSRGAVEP
ncbi:hypothetical protein [uncultured Roseobacter sp.]|uniref:hypothetical protein n=1 Tax=uncultured Roseobacter sp. TaxID=114847 RepID=UPI00262A3864|nr:hypothetical protein [uncultured Roseobacter sp.]